jgi:hypothetical protein
MRPPALGSLAVRLGVPFVAGAVFLASPFRAVTAQAAAPAAATAAERDSVLAIVQRFFAAMEAQDTANLRRLMLMDGHMVAASSRGDTMLVGTRPNEEFLTQLPKSAERWRERIWEPQVLLHGALAVVWAPYDFYLGAGFSHCGVDSFTLARGKDGWRIVDVAFTIEPEGCAPSPLGPRKEREP